MSVLIQRTTNHLKLKLLAVYKTVSQNCSLYGSIPKR